MRAKFVCQSVTEFGWGNKSAELTAVSSGNPEDNQFSAATPSGQITINVDKDTPAKDYLVPGKKYYVDFTEAPE